MIKWALLLVFVRGSNIKPHSFIFSVRRSWWWRRLCKTLRCESEFFIKTWENKHTKTNVSYSIFLKTIQNNIQTKDYPKKNVSAQKTDDSEHRRRFSVFTILTWTEGFEPLALVALPRRPMKVKYLLLPSRKLLSSDCPLLLLCASFLCRAITSRWAYLCAKPIVRPHYSVGAEVGHALHK